MNNTKEIKNYNVAKYGFDLESLIRDEKTSIVYLAKDANLSRYAIYKAIKEGKITVRILRQLQDFFKSDL